MTNSVTQKPAPIATRWGRAAGFTLLEILVALAIVAILCAISFPLYNNYIEKAKLTVAINTLESTRKALEVYYIDNHSYPPSIDFTSGLDDQGRSVLPPELLGDFNRNFFAIVSYTASAANFSLSARAMDGKHTLLTLTPNQGILQEP